MENDNTPRNDFGEQLFRQALARQGRTGTSVITSMTEDAQHPDIVVVSNAVSLDAAVKIHSTGPTKRIALMWKGDMRERFARTAAALLDGDEKLKLNTHAVMETHVQYRRGENVPVVTLLCDDTSGQPSIVTGERDALTNGFLKAITRCLYESSISPEEERRLAEEGFRFSKFDPFSTEFHERPVFVFEDASGKTLSFVPTIPAAERPNCLQRNPMTVVEKRPAGKTDDLQHRHRTDIQGLGIGLQITRRLIYDPLL